MTGTEVRQHPQGRLAVLAHLIRVGDEQRVPLAAGRRRDGAKRGEAVEQVEQRRFDLPRAGRAVEQFQPSGDSLGCGIQMKVAFRDGGSRCDPGLKQGMASRVKQWLEARRRITPAR